MTTQLQSQSKSRLRPYDYLKRLLDLIVSLTVLLLASPVLLLVALLLLVTMGRPLLFVQERPGKGGRPFRLYKFRTMLPVTDADASAVTAVASDGARLTRVGAALRASSLDELPELFNILRGDMSLVGPRPLLTDYLKYYSPQQARRMEVRPGLTGLAQVSGRNALSWEQRFELDVLYVDQRSLWLDCRIVLQTVAAVLSRKGISDQTATMTPFQGSSEGSTDQTVAEKH
ncbi:MAG: sugar transferase [Coriobacteriia bacterium]|nr:sugar transferase [Coriobacteriia bacterium]